MTHSRISAVCMFATVVFLIAVSSFPLCAQQATAGNAVVPTLVNFSGVLTGPNGEPLTNIAGNDKLPARTRDTSTPANPHLMADWFPEKQGADLHCLVRSLERA